MLETEAYLLLVKITCQTVKHMKNLAVPMCRRKKCIPVFFRMVCQEKIKRVHKIKERPESLGQSFMISITHFSESGRRVNIFSMYSHFE